MMVVLLVSSSIQTSTSNLFLNLKITFFDNVYTCESNIGGHPTKKKKKKIVRESNFGEIILNLQPINSDHSGWNITTIDKRVSTLDSS